MREHHLEVRRTARYVTLGPTDSDAVALVFALHGYGQLAASFATALAPIDDGARAIVVPEGLSRHYRDATSGEVGASWMTREDREHEIGDYVAYLDAVFDAVSGVGDSRPTDLIGFSQGSVTAWRWIAAGRVRPRRLIVWGGEIPPDLNWAAVGDRIRTVEVVLVAGTADQYATPEHMVRYAATLDAQAVRHRTITFDGGHRLDTRVLGDLFAPSQDS